MRVEGSGFGFEGSGSGTRALCWNRVQGVGSRVYGSGLRVRNLEFGFEGSGFRV